MASRLEKAMPVNDARRYSVIEDGVRMVAEPSTSATILVDNLGRHDL